MTSEPLEEPFQRDYPLKAPIYAGAFDAAERFCLRCNERLYQDGPALCPACGLQYDGSNPDTFRSRPMFLRWKFWFPGVCTAIVCGIVSYAICLQGGELGWALFGAVPLSVGAILGYATRISQWGAWMAVLAVTLTAVTTVIGLFGAGLAGVLCGLMLAVIFIVPVGVGFLLGALIGAAVRKLLAASTWDQRWFLPLIGFIALPYVAQIIENRVRPRLEPAVVSTRLSIHATPEEAWNAIVFYEDVEHPPPLFLRLLLPKAKGSHGSKEHVGDVVRCEYEQGYIVKRITRVEPGRLLAFEVLEQNIDAERNAIALDGSFELVPRGDGRTELILTTRYQRRLAPKWMWEPTERKVLHTLHGHVLEGMRRKVLKDRSETIEPPETPYPPEKAPAPAV